MIGRGFPEVARLVVNRLNLRSDFELKYRGGGNYL